MTFQGQVLGSLTEFESQGAAAVDHRSARIFQPRKQRPGITDGGTVAALMCRSAHSTVVHACRWFRAGVQGAFAQIPGLDLDPPRDELLQLLLDRFVVLKRQLVVERLGGNVYAGSILNRFYRGLFINGYKV